MSGNESEPPAETGDVLLKSAQAAAILGVSKETFRQLYRAGKIPYYQPSKGIIRFRRADLEEYRRQSFKGK